MLGRHVIGAISRPLLVACKSSKPWGRSRIEHRVRIGAGDPLSASSRATQSRNYVPACVSGLGLGSSVLNDVQSRLAVRETAGAFITL
jgi:hypothetical protein